MKLLNCTTNNISVKNKNCFYLNLFPIKVIVYCKSKNSFIIGKITKHGNSIRKEGKAQILFIKKIKKTKFSSLAPAVRYQQAAHCSIYSELFALSEGAFRTVIINQPLWISNLCKWTYNILHVRDWLCCLVLLIHSFQLKFKIIDILVLLDYLK